SAITSVHAMVVKTASAIDGDTLKLNSKTKIRLLGIDAPEIYAVGLKNSTCPSVEKNLGLKARARMGDLLDLSQHKVTVKFAKGVDKYGRRLGDVFSDGQNVAKIMVAEKLALPWDYPKQKRPSFCLPDAIKHFQYKRHH